MQHNQLKQMPLEQLWSLHEAISIELSRKLALEKAKLEERLHKIGTPTTTGVWSVERTRRPYPKVLPKYRNPNDPKETWAGRGKQPRWLTSQLRSGKKLDQFLIRRS